MKKNPENNEINRKLFISCLKGYLNSFEDVLYLKPDVIHPDHRSFGWALCLYWKKSKLFVTLGEPKNKLKIDSDTYILFTENPGVLRIKVRSKTFNESFERECHQRLPESAVIRNYFKSLSESLAAQSELSQMKAPGLIQLLCTTFTELVFDAPHLDKYLSDSKRQMMLRINSCIRSNFGTSFSAREISEELGFSLQYLNKVSREFRGLTLNNYINFCKLEIFRSRLFSCDDKVSSIASDCGFQDVNYLIQLFKKTYYITPHSLRLKFKTADKIEMKELHRTYAFQALASITRPKEINQLSVKDKRCSIIICNLQDEPLEVYWISPDREEVPMTLLFGRERVHFGSAEGHVWMLKRKSENGYCRVEAANGIICF